MLLWVSGPSAMCELSDLQGGVSTAMIGIHSVPAAVGFRIVLGALESGFFPGV